MAGTYPVEIPANYLPLSATIERMTDQENETWTAVYSDVPCRRGIDRGGLLLGREQVSGAQEIQKFVFNKYFNGAALVIKPEDRIRLGTSAATYVYYRLSLPILDVESVDHHLTVTVESWYAAGDL